jgi:hypothetical protein
MDDETLSARLNASAPSTAPRDERLDAALQEVVISTRPLHQRRTRSLLGGIGLSLVLLGGTTAALASEPILDWLTFAPDQTLAHMNADGYYCVAGIVVQPDGVAEDDPAFRAAKDILLGIDFDTLEIPDDIQNSHEYTAEAEAARASSIAELNAAHPDATFEPAPPDPTSSMLVATAVDVINAGVTAEGLDPSHFTIEAGGTCDEVAR